MADLPTAIFLMGPTASGKTDLAIELCQALPCDIISVDSALIYRGMDIGTAKPSAAELALAPHRLIDILDPAVSYSAADFCKDALREMKEIADRYAFRCWWVAPCSISRRCWRGSLRCLPPTPPFGPASRRRPPVWAGRLCTMNWCASTRWPVPASIPMTRSGSAGRSKSTASAARRSPS